MSPHINPSNVKRSFCALALAATIGLGGLLSPNASAKSADLDDLFEHSGFTDRVLFRCALDSYKDANGMVSDYELFDDMYYAGWNGKTFDSDKAANVKSYSCYGSGITDASFAGLSQFGNLETLYISAPSVEMEDLSGLASLTELKNLHLSLGYSGYVTNINAIANFDKLEQLVLRGHIGSAEPISQLTNLKKLSLQYIYTSPDVNHKMSDISFLAPLTDLETLDLRENNITDLSPLSNLTNLKYLVLDGNENLADLTPLDSLTNLEYVDLLNERETDKSQTGDPSIHPKFNDGVLYKGVVDSYYYQNGDYPLGSSPFFDIEYDKAAHRQEILTDEQLASIEHLIIFDGTPVASKMVIVNDTTGLGTMPNLKSIVLSMSHMGDDDIDFSVVPKLEEFSVFSSGNSTFDFSHNPELKDVYLWQSFVTELDFSNNPKLQKLTIWSDRLAKLDISDNPALTQLAILGGPSLESVALTNSENIKEFFLTGSSNNGEPITSGSIKILPPKSVKLREFGGRGGDDDTEATEAEPYIFDISSLEFLQNSNTNIDGTLENETFTVGDPSCYSYDADAKVIIVKASCVDAGLTAATLTHAYDINGEHYENEFTIDFNLDSDEDEDEEESDADTPATPNTGLFTNEDGSLNASNALFFLGGVSILAFALTGLTIRIKKRLQIRF